MDKKLEVKNLKISFRTQGGHVKAVRDISFDLYKGETLAIVGESGSGKSVTSKAIIGILAGNSIVESGEILYDGADLLKISEDDFHKIRGDKISMIFQDPMSSLNPIMRVGKQLTEAMILKGKTSQKNARKIFNDKINRLNIMIDSVTANGDKAIAAKNKEMCKTFDMFCITSTKLEQDFNEAKAATVDLKLAAEDLLFLLEKKQKVDLVRKIKALKKYLSASLHPYVIKDSDEVKALIDFFNTVIFGTRKNTDPQLVMSNLKKAITLVDSVEEISPNFFTLGYYIMKNPDYDYLSKDINFLNTMTREYLDKEFMHEFIALATKGIQHSHSISLKAKKIILANTDAALDYFRQETLDKKEVFRYVDTICYNVKMSIDNLSIVKKSAEYSFKSAIYAAINAYFKGVENNPKNLKKYEAQERKYNKLVESGKKPTWKLVPPVLVDLEQAKKNIRQVLHSLRHSIREDIQLDETFDAKEKTIELIDYLKEQASKVVYKVTNSMAKAKALKLLEEVGIPDPHIRFKQFPFEFSGGMRQRIVIAIALSANPDILICDEPTTALDVTIQSQILELINKIKVERNLSVIFITHDLGVVANMADRVAVMYAGKIVEYGTSDDIFYDPKHPYTWALLSSMPDLETKEKLEAIPGTPPNMIYPPKGDAFAERNKYALEIDFELQPPLFEVSETHYAATWLLHPNAPKVDPPKIITERIARMKGEAKNYE